MNPRSETPGMVIRHPSGLIEIHTTEGLLILLESEYQRQKRRGLPVERNRLLASIDDERFCKFSKSSSMQPSGA